MHSFQGDRSQTMFLSPSRLCTINMKRKGKKGLMAVKLDMSKTYDRVKWKYLEEVMRRMGF